MFANRSEIHNLLANQMEESTAYASVKVEKPKREPKGIKDVKRKPQHQPILIL
jgi:hypothetical protein